MAILKISGLPFFVLKAKSNEKTGGFTLFPFADWVRWWLLKCAFDGLHPSALAYRRFVDRLMPPALPKLDR